MTRVTAPWAAGLALLLLSATSPLAYEAVLAEPPAAVASAQASRITSPSEA